MDGRRKVDKQGRLFNNSWKLQYFAKQHNSNQAICVICNQVVAVLKEYNLRRHYVTRHPSYDQYHGKEREEKYNNLSTNLAAQQHQFTRYNKFSEKATKCSLMISERIGQRQLPFQHGEFASEVLTAFVETFCPEKKEYLENISLSRNTITRRIETLSNDIERTAKERARSYVYFSIALDESTDHSDTAQMAIMIRGVDDHFNITEDYLTMASLHGKTTGNDIFQSLLKELEVFNLPLERLSGVSTDGAPAMAGTQRGLVGLLLKSRLWEVPPFVYHCIIHQENLAAQTLKMNHVMDLVVSTVNFIRSRALNHRQFKTMLEEIESEYKDVTYYCKVRWLSSAKTLRRFFSLLGQIDTFMRSKDSEHEEFTDGDWINDLAFLCDITEHLAVLNQKLQGKRQHVAALWQHITAFRTKLQFWSNQLRDQNCIHFTTLHERHQKEPIDTEVYATIVSDLSAEFERRFPQFDETKLQISLFSDPFSVTPNHAPPELQMELIDLQANDRLKSHHNSHDIIEFYHDFLPKETFPQIYKHALFMASLFGSTYLCEQFFSRMKHTKNKYRTTMTDEHLTQQLRVSVSTTKADIDRIVKEKQYQVSH